MANVSVPVQGNVSKVSIYSKLYLALCNRTVLVTADVNGVVRIAFSVKGTLSCGRTGILVNIVNSCCGRYFLFIKFRWTDSFFRFVTCANLIPISVEISKTLSYEMDNPRL